MPTNPNNIVRIHSRNGGRTSVYEANMMAQKSSVGLFHGSGVVQNTSADMNVLVGGTPSNPDVIVAENPSGYKVLLDIVERKAIPITAPISQSRISLIVVYTTDLSVVSTSTGLTGSPESCGIIVVNGSSSGSPAEPSDSDIRSAISADGASGSQSSYAVLAKIKVASSTTTITNSIINIVRSAQDNIIRLENVNINTAVVAGKYGVYFVKSSCSNIPYGTDLILYNYHTSSSSGWDKQIAFDYSPGSGRRWERRMNSGIWSRWVEMGNEFSYVLNNKDINDAIPNKINGTWYIQNGNTNVPQNYAFLQQYSLGLSTIYDRQILYDIYTMEPKWYRKRDNSGPWSAWKPYGSVFFSAYKSSSASVSAGWSTIVCNTQMYDSGNSYNTSTGKFTAPINGIYAFDIAINTDSATTVRAFASIETSGSTKFGSERGRDGDMTNTRRATVSVQGYMAAGASIWPRLYTSSALSNVAGDTCFSGHLVKVVDL